MMHITFEELNREIVSCRKCPRLVKCRESVSSLKRYEHEVHWRKPVRGYGDRNSWLLIIGLAPAAQGGNRTGRVFTGDASARFLMPVLYKAGLANQPDSEYLDDGLELYGCYITAAVKCVPPQNKPTRQEFLNCHPYFMNEFFLLKNLKAVLALGKLAFDAYQHFLVEQKVISKRHRFGHETKVEVAGWPTLYGAYHPSPRNTNTGRLTESMLLSLLRSVHDQEKNPETRS